MAAIRQPADTEFGLQETSILIIANPYGLSFGIGTQKADFTTIVTRGNIFALYGF